jgi:hypothetical protein
LTSVGITAAASWNINISVGLEQSAEWDIDATPVELCPPTCDAFRQVTTDFMVDGMSRVCWQLRPDLIATTPYIFQLQVGETANPLAADWKNVGSPLTNTFTAVDAARRALGKQLVTHYRVVMQDGDGVYYYSPPATVLGGLNLHDWLIAREIIRQALLKLRVGPGGIKGYLLKKKRSGARCTRCLDPLTGDVLDSQCPVCEGTRFVAGYYSAMPCQYADLTNVSLEEQRTDGPDGWGMPTRIKGRFLGSPLISTGDIWVDAASDLRYYASVVEIENRVKGVPITLQVGLEQLPFHNVAYGLSLS